jgi:hypothetical protein
MRLAARNSEFRSAAKFGQMRTHGAPLTQQL